MARRRYGGRFYRNPKHGVAVLKNLTRQILKEEAIKTTLPKAKCVRGHVERLITLARENTLHHQRRAFSVLQDKDLVKKLFDVIAPRFLGRPGGYTRVLKAGYRLGDAAPMAYIELVN